MTMELSQIRAFLALAETLNFTRAAEACDISQPTLSRAIKALEAELGGPLIRRERGRSHLTELGRIVRPHLAQAMSLTDVVKAEAIDFSKMTTAKLTLGVMCTVGPGRMIALVDHLTRRVPQLQLHLRDATGDELVAMLLAGEIDVGIVGLPTYPDELDVHPIYTEQYVIAFPPGHRFERHQSVSWSDLAGERYLERLNCESMEHYEHKFGEIDLHLDIRYSSEHEDWIQAMILAGLGCACMPEFMPLFPAVKTRPLVQPELRRTISLVTVRGRRHSPVVDMFSRLCRSMKWAESTD
jgi:LysR family transcriptional regulator, hydrogen peroxide-inducible genes activator